jgi:hypothetical protein
MRKLIQVPRRTHSIRRVSLIVDVLPRICGSTEFRESRNEKMQARGIITAIALSAAALPIAGCAAGVSGTVVGVRSDATGTSSSVRSGSVTAGTGGVDVRRTQVDTVY